MRSGGLLILCLAGFGTTPKGVPGETSVSPGKRRAKPGDRAEDDLRERRVVKERLLEKYVVAE
jgi:hypothetical protein